MSDSEEVVLVSESDSWESSSESDEEQEAVPPPKRPRARGGAAPATAAAPTVREVKGPDPNFDPTEYQLPRELQQADDTIEDYDSLSEDEDHVGYWREEDTAALVAALNHHRKALKGKFEGPGGGKDRRNAAWIKVAAHVNQRCGTTWTDKQCKGKAKRYAGEVKERYNAFRRELNKTGGGEVPEEKYLTDTEESMLDYIGVHGVIGIPGCSGVPLKPNTPMSANKRLQDNAKAVWDHDREGRPDYSADLPSNRIRCKPGQGGRGKSKSKTKK